MSKEKEDAWQKWSDQQKIDCARDLVVGAKVYRATYSCIEEGTVVKVSKCFINPNGDLREDPKGDFHYYAAKFGTGFDGYVTQTYQWKFFFNLKDAQKDLIRKLERRISDHRFDVSRLEKQIEELRKSYVND